jgi:hypothetical protein
VGVLREPPKSRVRCASHRACAIRVPAVAIMLNKITEQGDAVVRRQLRCEGALAC